MTNVSRTKLAYLNAARAISKLSDHRCQMGAVIVSGHKIIGSGYNSATKTDPYQASLDTKKYGVECAGYVHAEISALLPFIKKKNLKALSGATVYIYREDKLGRMRLSKPCSNCEMVLRACGIKCVVFSTNTEGQFDCVYYK